MSVDDWLAGFVDGEGCFQIKPTIARGRTYFYPMFVIGLRDDDEPLLRGVVERVGLGRIEYSSARQGTDYYSQRQVRWIVKRKAECQELARLLHAHPLRSKKARDFELWAAAVDEVNGERRVERMRLLADRLRDVRKYPSGTANSPMLDSGRLRGVGA